MIPTNTLKSVLSDAELILSTRAGDSDAYAELYSRHVDSAKAAAHALTRSKADVDDIVAEAFSRVLSVLQRGGGPDVSFRPYLLTSVRNAFYDRTRKAKREEVTDEVEDSVNFSLLDMTNSEDDRALVATAFASLPERWQLVLWHTEVEGRSPAEVAPLIGLAPNAVAALAYRAREGLRTAYLQSHLQQPMDVSCKECATNLGAYVRDGLSARDRRRVEDHLEGCASCKALLVELQDANTHLRAVLIPLIVGVPAAKYLSALGLGKGLTTTLKLVKVTALGHPAAAGAVAASVVAVMTVATVAAVRTNDNDSRKEAGENAGTSVDAGTIAPFDLTTIVTTAGGGAGAEFDATTGTDLSASGDSVEATADTGSVDDTLDTSSIGADATNDTAADAPQVGASGNLPPSPPSTNRPANTSPSSSSSSVPIVVPVRPATSSTAPGSSSTSSTALTVPIIPATAPTTPPSATTTATTVAPTTSSTSSTVVPTTSSSTTTTVALTTSSSTTTTVAPTTSSSTTTTVAPTTSSSTTTVAPTTTSSSTTTTVAPTTTTTSTTLPPTTTTTTTTLPPTTTTTTTTLPPTTTTTTTLPPTSTTTTVPNGAPSLAIGAELVAPPFSGGTAIVRINVANGTTLAGNGRSPMAGPANNLVVSIPVPNGVTFAGSSNPAWSCSTQGGVITCLIGTLADGTRTNSQISLQLSATQGNFNIEPRVSADGVNTVTSTGGPLTIRVTTVAGMVYSNYDRGSVVVAGNTNMTCLASTQCTNAQQGKGGNGFDDNNRQGYVMVHVKPAGSTASLNQSTAAVNLANSTVTRAYLVVGGDTRENGVSAPNPSARNSVKLTSPDGFVHDLTSSSVSTWGDGLYSALFDVSAIVTSSGKYTVADIQAASTGGSFAGWSLVIVTHNDADPLRLLAVVTPNSTMSPLNDYDLTVPLQAGTANRKVRVTTSTFEDELGYFPDRFVVNDTTLSSAASPLLNAFNATVVGAVSPAYPNSMGVGSAQWSTAIAANASLRIHTDSALDIVRMAVYGIAIDF